MLGRRGFGPGADRHRGARAALAGDRLRSRSARALGARSRVPDLTLLALVAFASVAALAAVGALLATALLVVPAATARLWTQSAAAWQLASVALAAAEGLAGSGSPCAPTPRPARRSRRSRAARLPLVASSLERDSVPMSASHMRKPVARSLARRRCSPPAAVRTSRPRRCTGRRRTSGRGRIDDPARRHRPPGRRATRAEVHQILQPNTDPHDYEPRPDDVRRRRRQARHRVRQRARPLDGARSSSRRAASPTEVAIAPDHTPHKVARARTTTTRDGEEHAGRSSTRTGGTTRATSRRPSPSIRDELDQGRPGNADDLSRQRRRATGEGASARRGHRSLHRARSRRPSASSSPSHDAFGYFAARYGITVVGAVIPSQTHAGPAVRGRARASCRRRSGASSVQGRLPRELGQPELAETIAAPDRRQAPTTTLYGDTLGPRGLGRRDYLGDGGAPTPTRWSRASPAARSGCSIARPRDRRRAGLAVGYRGGPPVLDGRHLRGRAAASGSASSDPTAAARRRSSACCSASSRRCAGTLDGPGALRNRAADRALAAGLSRSARSTSSLMGALARCPGGGARGAPSARAR